MQWAASQAVLILAVAAALWRQGWDRTAVLAFAYFLLNSVNIFANKVNIYEHADGAVRSVITGQAATSSFAVLLILAALYMSRHYMLAVHNFLAASCILNAAYTVLGAVFRFGFLPLGIGSSGFLDYASLNGCLIAATFPFWLDFSAVLNRYPRLISFALILASIVLSKSSIPYGVLGVTLACHFACESRRTFFVILIPIVIAMALPFEGRHLFDSAYRFEAYRVFMGTWWHKLPHYFGTGNGTYSVLAIETQFLRKFMVSSSASQPNSFFWIYLHSDWLQMVYEFGFVGAAIFSALFLRLAYLFWTTSQAVEFASLMGLASTACFNFPLRYFLGSCLLLYLVMRGASPVERA